MTHEPEGPIEVPVDLPVLISQDEQAMFPAHGVAQLLRNIATVYRQRPSLSPVSGLDRMADALDHEILKALTAYRDMLEE